MCYRGGFHKRVIKLTLAHPRNSPPVLSVHQQVSPMHSLFGSTGSLGHLSFKKLLNSSEPFSDTKTNCSKFLPFLSPIELSSPRFSQSTLSSVPHSLEDCLRSLSDCPTDRLSRQLTGLFTGQTAVPSILHRRKRVRGGIFVFF